MKTVAIINQKGGVGKTTTTVNLGAALAERGLSVLMIDLDPQANLGTHLGIDIAAVKPTIYDVLVGPAELSEAIHPVEDSTLQCVPSTLDLSAAEMELVSMMGRETLLRDQLQALRQADPDRFDVVLIDCPPSLGVLSVNALAAADEVLVPLQAEFFALQGMAKLLEVIHLVRSKLNPRLRLAGIVACRVDRRTRLTAEVINEVREYFGDVLLRTVIRPNVKLAEAPSYGCSVIDYDPNSRGALDYRTLAAEWLGEEVEDGLAYFAEPEELAEEELPTPEDAGEEALQDLDGGDQNQGQGRAEGSVEARDNRPELPKQGAGEEREALAGQPVSNEGLQAASDSEGAASLPGSDQASAEEASAEEASDQQLPAEAAPYEFEASAPVPTPVERPRVDAPRLRPVEAWPRTAIMPLPPPEPPRERSGVQGSSALATRTEPAREARWSPLGLMDAPALPEGASAEAPPASLSEPESLATEEAPSRESAPMAAAAAPPRVTAKHAVHEECAVEADEDEDDDLLFVPAGSRAPKSPQRSLVARL